jgi:hypothetical protein
MKLKKSNEIDGYTGGKVEIIGNYQAARTILSKTFAPSGNGSMNGETVTTNITPAGIYSSNNSFIEIGIASNDGKIEPKLQVFGTNAKNDETAKRRAGSAWLYTAETEYDANMLAKIGAWTPDTNQTITVPGSRRYCNFSYSNI